MILSEDQAEAVRRIVHWYRHEREYQPVFSLGGYAGTGKSTVVAYAIEELGLPRHKIVYCAYTMKAALILQRNRLPATTIHKLIKIPVEPSAFVYQRAREELAELREACPEDMPRQLWLRRIRDLEQQLDNIRSLKFVLNTQSKLRGAALCVVDECSMVDQELADDLLSFGRPTLVVGDNGQLPPVKGGNSPFSCASPDIQLTQIHRQAAESPIIRLATMTRKGEHIPFGHYGSTVAKLRYGRRPADELLEPDYES